MGKVEGGAECSVCSPGCCFLREHGSQERRGSVHTPSPPACTSFPSGALLSSLLSAVPAQPEAGPGTSVPMLLIRKEPQVGALKEEPQGGALKEVPQGEALKETSRSSTFSHLGALRCMTAISPGLRAAQAMKDHLLSPPLL